MLTTLLILPHNIVNNCDFRAILHSFVMFWMFHAHHHCHWKFWLFWGQGLLDWLQNCVKSSIDFLLSESWQVLLQVSQPRDICSQYRLQHFRIDKYLVTAKYSQSSRKKKKTRLFGCERLRNRTIQMKIDVWAAPGIVSGLWNNFTWIHLSSQLWKYSYGCTTLSLKKKHFSIKSWEDEEKKQMLTN